MTVADLVKLIGFAFGLILIYAPVAAFYRVTGLEKSLKSLLVAYAVISVAVVFLDALGAADGGPLNFERAPLMVFGCIIVFAIDFLIMRGRQSERRDTAYKTTSSPPLPSPQSTEDSSFRKHLITAGKTGVVAVIGIAAFMLAKPIGRMVGDQYRAGKQEGALAVALRQAATELSKQLPKRLDKVTTLTAVMSVEGTLIYSYRLDFNKDKIDTRQFLGAKKTRLTDNVCNTPSMRVTLRAGGTFAYQYMDETNRRIGEVEVTEKSCPK